MLEELVVQSPTEIAKFEEYLKSNLTSDLVLRVLEECLVEENSTYNTIDFEKALANLQQKDSGRYYMLKLLLEGYATKEGQVLLDPKLVNASYKARMKELETLKAMSRFRRLWYRLGQAFVGWLREKNQTEAIQEAIEITGEVQIARDELATLELKRQKIVAETNEIQIKTSDERRQKLEDADRIATEKVETAFKDAREQLSFSQKQLDTLYEKISEKREEIAALDRERFQLIQRGVSTQSYAGSSQSLFGS